MSCTGFDGWIGYNTATDASPTWVEVDTARDVSTTASAGKADVSDRRTKFKMSCPSLLDLETTVTVTWVANDTALTAVRNQFLNRTSAQWAIMDGDIATSGSEGWKFYAHVYSNDFEQPLEDGMTVQFTLSPTIDSSEPTVFPSWLVVS